MSPHQDAQAGQEMELDIKNIKWILKILKKDALNSSLNKKRNKVINIFRQPCMAQPGSEHPSRLETAHSGG